MDPEALILRVKMRAQSCRDNAGSSDREQGFLDAVNMMEEFVENIVCVLEQAEEQEQENPPQVEAMIQRQEEECCE